ncbi:hypothetical protein H8959_010839, partial [Pygathrix nigripes]
DIINYCVALPKANSTSILLFLTVVVALRINKCIRISFNQYPIEFPMELFLIIGFTVIANKINMATETSQTLIDMIPYRAKILLLGQIPNTNIYRSVNDYREIVTIPGVKIFQCCSSITFVNVYYLKHKLLKEVDMVRVPLKEEEIFSLFNSSDTSLQGEKICRCFCNCDDLQPLPRILYTERFENKLDPDASSVNLIHCSHFESRNTSQTASEDQVPYTVSSMSQKNQGQQYEAVEKVWLPNSSRNSSPGLPDVAESQGRRSLIPYSDASLLPSVHTIILDFSMVHYVDSQGLVVLRQICNAFQNANILILIAGCHSSIVRAFERNDFFDAGITKTQLFLSVHDAVLFALSRKVIDSSKLSIDESETVIRETYSETEKVGQTDKAWGWGKGLRSAEGMGFTKIQQPIEEESELDLELESEQEAGLGLDLDLDRELEPESELEPEMEPRAEAETETETKNEMEPQPETEPEMEPDPKSRPRAHTFPQQHYWPMYHPCMASTQSQTQPRTWSVERRRHPMDSYSPEGNSNEDV